MARTPKQLNYHNGKTDLATKDVASVLYYDQDREYGIKTGDWEIARKVHARMRAAVRRGDALTRRFRQEIAAYATQLRSE